MVMHDETCHFQAANTDEEESLLQRVSSADSQLLRTLSADGRTLQVVKFAKANNLAHQTALFEKAATLLQSEGRPEDISTITKGEIEALQKERRHKWSQPWTLYFLISICSIGAIEQGMAQTSMNGANLYFPKELGIGSDSSGDKFLVGLINSGIYLAVGVL
jgi:hypothetical protein